MIKPSWEDYEQEDSSEVVLEIDPGMSFGTGNHGTTKACLQFIDKCTIKQEGLSFLDAGCGSGILSMAAERLGCDPVDAFDYDPEAVTCTKNNFAESAKDSKVNIFQADLTSLDLDRTYDVVAANILAPVLIGASDKLMNHIQPGSKLILAGILTEQYPEVKAKFEGHGLKELESATIDEWTSGLFEY